MEALQLFASLAPKCDYLKSRANSRELLYYMLGTLGDDHPELSALICSCLARDPGVNGTDRVEDF